MVRFPYIDVDTGEALVGTAADTRASKAAHAFANASLGAPASGDHLAIARAHADVSALALANKLALAYAGGDYF